MLAFLLRAPPPPPSALPTRAPAIPPPPPRPPPPPPKEVKQVAMECRRQFLPPLTGVGCGGGATAPPATPPMLPLALLLLLYPLPQKSESDEQAVVVGVSESSLNSDGYVAKIFSVRMSLARCFSLAPFSARLPRTFSATCVMRTAWAGIVNPAETSTPGAPTERRCRLR